LDRDRVINQKARLGQHVARWKDLWPRAYASDGAFEQCRMLDRPAVAEQFSLRERAGKRAVASKADVVAESLSEAAAPIHHFGHP